MDAVKDFWTELKERINNPFMGSFMIAWLIINYPIPITLIFYKQADLRPQYTSYLDVINKTIDGWNMVFIPLIIATCYTFGFPYFKTFVSVFLAKRSQETDKKISENANGTMVPIEKYLQSQNNYSAQQVNLAKIIAEEEQAQRNFEAQLVLMNDKDEVHKSEIEQLNEQHAATIASKETEHNQSLQHEKAMHILDMDALRNEIRNAERKGKEQFSHHKNEVEKLNNKISTLTVQNTKASEIIQGLQNELNAVQDSAIITNPFLIQHRQLLENWHSTGKVTLMVPATYRKMFESDKKAVSVNAIVFNKILGYGRLTDNNNISSFKILFGDADLSVNYDEIELFMSKSIKDI